MSPPLSFGDLFRRKVKKQREESPSGKSSDQRAVGIDAEPKGTGPGVRRKTNGNRLTISSALDLLEKMENEKVSDMSRSLIPIRQSLENSLLTVGRLAKEMENEKVKVEEEKFKPTVESSRKILVSSLKKEVSSNFPTPTSISEAKKFQERLQSLMERFGDVSGSHNKVLTTFMKKHTGKIKGEFDTISSLEKRTNKVMEYFEEDRRPVADCIKILTKTSQMLDSIHSQEGELQKVQDEISRLEAEAEDLARKLDDVERSSDFESASKTLHEIKLAQDEEKEFHKYLGDLFSPVSRALAKYSYGTSKSTSSRLQILMKTPWKIFEQPKEEKMDFGQLQESQCGELDSYKSLLAEVYKAVSTGKITLKDSDKTVKHFEQIVESLPSLSKRSKLISDKLKSLENKKDNSVISISEDLRMKLRNNKVALDNHRLYLERLENEINDKRNNQLRSMVRECEECLSTVMRKKFALEIPGG
jgi:DNA repair ATPase RecN